MMLRHITRVCFVIIFLSETQPQGVFVLDGKSNESLIDFLQPISLKMYLERFRYELFLVRTLDEKGKENSFLPGL